LSIFKTPSRQSGPESFAFLTKSWRHGESIQSNKHTAGGHTATAALSYLQCNTIHHSESTAPHSTARTAPQNTSQPSTSQRTTEQRVQNSRTQHKKYNIDGTLQYSTAPTVQSSTAQHREIQSSTMQYRTEQYNGSRSQHNKILIMARKIKLHVDPGCGLKRLARLNEQVKILWLRIGNVQVIFGNRTSPAKYEFISWDQKIM
jgi:hypothetical protein